MLLKRFERENGTVEALYESSNIIASRYCKNTNQLTLTFKAGDEYIYEKVAISDYHKLELADSQGVAFSKYLRSYPFTKGPSVDIIALRERILGVKQEEINNLTINIVEICKQIVETFDETAEINESFLRDMIRMIDYRKEKMKK